MDNLTIVIPYYEERQALDRLLATVPAELPVIIVDDQSTQPLQLQRSNTSVLRPAKKGYFTGAVNTGIQACRTDVLILNQDVTLTGTEWLNIIARHRDRYALIGERIKGENPVFPQGYVHGVFQFMRRDAINKVGLMNEELYPLWGASALWQLQICRQGFESFPLTILPGVTHHRIDPFGTSITKLLHKEPSQRSLFIRTPPLVSVVIPCYNHGKYLEDTINSLIGGNTSLGSHPGQTFQSFEVVIVDDGSDKKTQEQIEAVTDNWKGIRSISQRNKGTGGANNTGIRNSVGKYITLMSADDMREPWSLEDLYLAIVKHPDQYVYDAPVTFANGQRGKVLQLLPYDCEILPGRNMVPAGIMLERKAWIDAGGYREEMIYGREDWAFNIALARAGWHGHRIERSGYLYRREGQNKSLANGKLREFFLTQLMKLFPDVYSGEDAMCCNEKRGGVPAMKANPIQSFKSSSVPQGMTMIQYVGSNVGSQTWAGPGEVPTGRYYVFGNNPKDKVKFVDGRDAAWFINLREDGKRLFNIFVEPAAQEKPLRALTIVPTETDDSADPPAETLVAEELESKPEPEPEPEPLAPTQAIDPAEFFKSKVRGRPRRGAVQ